MIADLVARHGGVLGAVSRLSGGVHDELPRFPADAGPAVPAGGRQGLALDLHIDESGETGAQALRGWR